MNRGAGRRTVFADDVERQIFVDLIAGMDDRFDLEVHAFCLMGNHYHLLLRSRSGRLSEGMKSVGQQFTQRVNARRGVDGAIFRGRFHSVTVKHETHLTWMHRYINANPLELGWTAPLREYRWSGMGQMVGLRHDLGWLHTGHVDDRFGAGMSGFETFVERARTPGQQQSNQRSVERPDATDWAMVIDAANLTRAPGPMVHSANDVRTAGLYVACFVLHLVPDLAEPLVGLDPWMQRRAVERAADRVTGQPELRRYVERIVDVLALRGVNVTVPEVTSIVA